MRIAIAIAALAATALPALADDPYADFVASYVSGSGASPAYQNSSAALGAPTGGATITVPAFGNTNIVGIGLGGELTLGFDTPIANDPAGHAGGMDFTIFGNEFFVLGSGTITGVFNHPGLSVWVSQDNVAYYQLSATNGADDLFPTQGSGDPGTPVDPSFTLSSFIGLTGSQALGLYAGSAGGASYSISWARDAGGAPVDLPSISYVRIQGSGGYGYIDSVSRVSSVPEPGAAAWLSGCGVLAWLALRRPGR